VCTVTKSEEKHLANNRDKVLFCFELLLVEMEGVIIYPFFSDALYGPKAFDAYAFASSSCVS
jgi:hypothetical protein